MTLLFYTAVREERNINGQCVNMETCGPQPSRLFLLYQANSVIVSTRFKLKQFLLHCAGYRIANAWSHAFI